jgi:hypothetical protein
MRVKADNRTVTAKLNDILMQSFPLARNTGFSNDLVSVHPDKDSKGKSVLFTWKKATLRLTENLRVKELDFTNTLVESELSKEAESFINNYLKPTVETQSP